MTLSVAELVQVSNRVLEAQREAQPDRDVMLVMFATPGNGPQPTLCLHTAEIDIERDRELVQSGAHLVTPTTRHIPDDCVPRSAKMRSRMAWWIAERQVRTYHPTAGALLLDHDGAVLETAHSNFLIVREGAVFSPPRASILPGISLKVVSELCAALGIAFHDQKVTVAECLSADEALLTGTSFGVVGVSQLNERPIPWPGPVLKSLTHAWNALVGVDIHRDYDR
jgi:branched-subunit amino acid aminotransferase/4-amino-4-deoxychorismate lyase